MIILISADKPTADPSVVQFSFSKKTVRSVIERARLNLYIRAPSERHLPSSAEPVLMRINVFSVTAVLQDGAVQVSD